MTLPPNYIPPVAVDEHGHTYCTRPITTEENEAWDRYCYLARVSLHQAWLTHANTIPTTRS